MYTSISLVDNDNISFVLQTCCFGINTHKVGVYLLLSHPFIIQDGKCSGPVKYDNASEQRQHDANKLNWLFEKEKKCLNSLEIEV